MRLLGPTLGVAGMIAATCAQAQSPSAPETPSLESFRPPPIDGRLIPLSQNPDWTARPAPEGEYRLRWRGTDQEWDVSGATRFVEETRAHAADFQTPGLFETEAAVVRRIGDFRIGAVGYTAREVGQKAGRGPRLGSMRWQGQAAGPIVGYDATVAGKPATLSLRWYREIDAPGEDGDTVSASFAVRF